MTRDSALTTPSRRTQSSTSVSLGLVGVVLFFIASGFTCYWSIHVFNQDSELVVHTHQVMTALEELLSSMKDAESGQRGYVITGKEEYLEPYDQALQQLDERFANLDRLSEKRTSQVSHLQDIKDHIRAKTKELSETILLRKTKGFDAAMAVVLTNRGKAEMDALRSDISSSFQEESELRDLRLTEMAGAYRTSVISILLTSLLGLFLSGVIALQVRRTAYSRDRQQWLQTGQVGLSTAIAGDLQVDQLAKNVLQYACEYLDSHVGVCYANDGNSYHRLATYGVADNSSLPDSFAPGDGLLGQAVLNCRTLLVRDIPEGDIAVATSIGCIKPRNLIVSHAAVDNSVYAVLELGFVHPLNALTIELLELVSNPIGIAFRSANDRAKLQDLLEETQRQSASLQVQSEELRVTNEELDEQSRALNETQTTLEQNNAQLEEQAQLLEGQRDDLNRAKEILEVQAKDLEQTIRFKSDFLSNMSHELRTPLNSCLILAKLLGDNREGNLTSEQIKYAQTIQSSGNDLLALISDILDLSKIEAGHMDILVQPVRVSEVLERMVRTFEPIAVQKSLRFKAKIESGAPETIHTDPQRLDQVLKNLLSNALKFTDTGEVTLCVQSLTPGSISFSVGDTGIGIDLVQHQMVFEAFRQADGTTNRKYGGTGLGLSISRELAHLLGGEIVLVSEPGKGSTFTVTIPEDLEPSSPTSVADFPTAISKPILGKGLHSGSEVAVDIDDDRGELVSGDRIILVVEDDETFSRLLSDLAHELGFKCLLAMSGESALALTLKYLPDAVLMDIGLPDQSGLSVIDQLKHDPRTRHIPIHVISGSDSARTAMVLGAVGYLMKPVKREDLVEAFSILETRLNKRPGRVLVVEDDEVQLESMRLLLDSHDVETVGVRSAAECLETLSTSTFECMVLDLSLPDATGFSLLDTLSKSDTYSFPPVIVYTGRELSPDEEQRLRKYSKSIIVKGAKSPERLLDEVSLFLHQVVADLPADKQRMIEQAKHRDGALEDRVILIVEDDIRNIFALTSILEPRGAKVEIARNGREAIESLTQFLSGPRPPIDLVLMDIMMPEMDGFTAMREIRKNPKWKKLPIIALTAKAMKSDQAQCIEAGANDYIAKPLDVEKLLSLIRVWMPPI